MESQDECAYCLQENLNQKLIPNTLY